VLARTLKLDERNWLLKPDRKRAVVLTVPDEAVLQRRRAGPLQIILQREVALGLEVAVCAQLGLPLPWDTDECGDDGGCEGDETSINGDEESLRSSVRSQFSVGLGAVHPLRMGGSRRLPRKRTPADSSTS
jgi:hypothetical protein